jgi:voltage-gated potassium channel
MSIREKVFNIVDENNKSGYISRTFNFSIVLLIILSVVSIILESYKEIYHYYETEFYVFEVFSVVIFSIEYLLRLWTVKYKYPEKSEINAFITYIFSPYALIDLFAILPFYVPLLIPVDLRFIRILRLLRVTRIFKLSRYSKSLKLIAEVFKEKRSDLGVTVFVTFILLIIASTIMYYLEHEKQPDAFPNIIASFWWAIATLTTVGYGDVYPITGWGKFISSIIALLGIGLVALPTGILSAAFMEKMQKNKLDIKSEEIKVDKKEKLICPYCGREINIDE